MHEIDLLVLDGGSAGALGATIDIFDIANRRAPTPLFDVRLLAAHPDVRVRGGLHLPMAGLDGARPRPFVLVLGAGDATPHEVSARLAGSEAAKVVPWLRQAAGQGALIAGSCTGVFFLGAAGLLDGRRCTTTWWMLGCLQALFPACCAGGDAMVTEDGSIWTAGAALAQIDLSLALLERLGGVELASEVSRRLLIDRRPSQAPFIAPLDLAHDNELALQVELLVTARMAEPLGLGDLARAVGLSQRTFDRRLQASTGLSPMRFVQKIRLRAALDLLRDSRLSHEAIAAKVGFADAAALYRLVLRHTGQAPGAFRSRGVRAPGTRPVDA